MISGHLKSPPLLVGVAVWLASLALYLSTVAPTLTWGNEKIGVDGGELLAAASTLGVPHPPGYPTYTLLLKAFATLVPVGDFAYRGNLLSAILASGSVALLYWVILRFGQFLKPEGPRLLWITSGALGAAVMATSPLFWSQAVMTEVYTLNTLFVAALLLIASHLALRLPSEREHSARYTTAGLALFGLLLGLGLGNHLTLLAVAAPLLLWLWSALGWRRLASPWAAGALVLGLSVYLYLPVRAGQVPPVNWGNADTLGGFAWMLSGRVYQDYVFGVPVGSIWSRVLEWVELVFIQFNPLGIFLGLMAVVSLRLRAPWFLATSLATIVILSVYSITYNTIDSEVLTIPTFVIFSVWVGVGFLWTVSSVSTWAQSAIGGLSSSRLRGARAAVSRSTLLLTIIGFGALPLASVILNYGSQNLRDDNGAYEHAKGILESVPDGSLVISAEEDSAFSLWYMRFVEDTERDVVPVAAPLLQFDWHWEELHARYPDRFPPETPPDVAQALRTIVEHNDGESRVFFTYWNSFLQENFDVQRTGRLYEAAPKSPP